MVIAGLLPLKSLLLPLGFSRNIGMWCRYGRCHELRETPYGLLYATVAGCFVDSCINSINIFFFFSEYIKVLGRVVENFLVIVAFSMSLARALFSFGLLSSVG